MKLIKYRENRYYPNSETEYKLVKAHLAVKGLTIYDLADHLKISYEALNRKLSIKHPNYFLEDEFKAMVEYINFDFEVS